MARGSKKQEQSEQQPAGDTYIVVTPLCWGNPEVRHIKGEDYAGPAESVPWLLEQGHLQLKGGE